MNINHPKDIDCLFSPVKLVKGIGPRRARILSEHGIKNVRDLLYMIPRKYLDRRSVVSIRDLWQYAGKNTEVTVIGTVRGKKIQKSFKRRDRFILVVGDENSFLDCIWFQRPHLMDKIFQKGERLALSGVVTDFQGTLQMIHPSFDRLTGSGENGEEPDWEEMLNTGRILPVYSETAEMKAAGLEGGTLRSIMLHVIGEYSSFIEEHLPAELLEQHKLIPYRNAICSAHFPENTESIEKSRDRLKYDELFYLQLLLAYRKRSASQAPGISFNIKSKFSRQIVDSLPFQLTDSQKRAIREITSDMESSRPMNRLLQGEVGSGKTIVSLFAMLIAVENGFQAVFMVPTEILALQHHATFKNFLSPIGINPVLLAGYRRKKEREEIERRIREGEDRIIIGTHALFQEGVRFRNPGLIVIDEQHRFGVVQRLRLVEKAFTGGSIEKNPDFLVLTATPIPRTLSMTLYGDLDLSILAERPRGRRPVKTVIRSKSEREKAYCFAYEEIKAGRQAYVVYPIIERSEKIDLKAAQDGYDELREGLFRDCVVEMLHGKMSGEEAEDIMHRFREGRVDLLVATTVIEVGVDVPNATIMIIEHAERFGLSQLHQLRGRVGRGSEQSYCILIHYLNPVRRSIAQSDGYISERSRIKEDEKQKGMIRMETIASTEDGFKIAETDLILRGPGEFFGARQSGFPGLKLASIIDDQVLLQQARQDAFGLVEKDPHLRANEHDVTRKYFEIYYKPLLEFIKSG